MASNTAALQSSLPIEAPITVRRVNGIDEYRQCERLQDVVWGPEDIAGVPLLDLVTAQENGGMVLGAFEDRRLVGFVYSFLGLTPTRQLKQCSVILCVDPEYRGLGLGLRLKLAQRNETLAQGIDLITWTFDPLLELNATLNIRRLGAVARHYQVNLYDVGRGLNAGLDTDRLLVEWWLRRRPWPEPRTTRGASASEVMVNQVRRNPATGLAENAATDLEADEPRVLISIPRDLAMLKRADIALARRWRHETRLLFETYFARRYVVVDFRRASGSSDDPTYILQRGAIR